MTTPTIRQVVAIAATGGNATVSLGAGTTSGDLLVIWHGNDFDTAANLPAPTTSQTVSNKTLQVTADPGTNESHLKVWTAGITVSGSQTVSCGPTAQLEDVFNTTVVIDGATIDLADFLDGTPQAGTSITNTASHVAPSVTTGTSDALLLCGAQAGTGSAVRSYTPPGGMTEESDITDGTFSTQSVASLVLTSSGATGTNTFTYGGSTHYATASIAIKGTAGGTPGIDLGLTPPTWWPGYGPWGAERFVPDPRSYDTDVPVTVVTGDAAVSGAGSVTASAVQEATAAPSGAGSVSADGVIAGSATVTGAGSVTATGSASGSATATVTGAGSVTALAVQGAGATQAGAGSVAAAAVLQATATVTGAGSVSALATQSAGSTVTGAGSVSANSGGSASGSATVTGAGSVSASATQAAGATRTGSGSVTAAAVQQATATVAGAGSVTATGSAAGGGTASATGAGSVTAIVVQQATASVTGSGSVAALIAQSAGKAVAGAGSVSGNGAIAGQATVTGTGSVGATVRQQATATQTGTGSVFASVGQTLVGTATVAGSGSVSASGRPKWVFRPNTGTTARPNSGTTARPFAGTTPRP